MTAQYSRLPVHGIISPMSYSLNAMSLCKCHQVGTVAKAVGDAMITVIGLHATELVDGLYFPLLLITAGTSDSLQVCDSEWGYIVTFDYACNELVGRSLLPRPSHNCNS